MKNFILIILIFSISCSQVQIIRKVRAYRFPPEIYRIQLPDSLIIKAESISRGELAYILVTRFTSYDLLGFMIKNSYIRPEDVMYYWSEEYINTSCEYRIMRILPDGNFYPDDPVKKFQMAIVLYRIVVNFRIVERNINILSASWNWVVENNILTGNEDDYISGEEAVRAVVNFCEYILD